MEIETIFTAWWFLLFTLMVFIPTEVIRRIAEAARPWLKDNGWWRDVFLTTFPVLLGIGLALRVRDYPFLVEQDSAWVRGGLGMAGGFFATWAVRVVKARLKKATGVDVDEVK